MPLIRVPEIGSKDYHHQHTRYFYAAYTIYPLQRQTRLSSIAHDCMTTNLLNIDLGAGRCETRV